MKMRNYGGTIIVSLVIAVLMIIGLYIAYFTENHIQSVTGLSISKTKAVILSKADIVKQMNQLAAEVARVERNAGIAGKGGFIVYSPQATAKLLALYQALELRLSYLNSGKLSRSPEQWDGYSLVKAKAKPYSTAQVEKVMAELKANGVPANLVTQFHIFLLPNSISKISGLGGAGFTLISAPADAGEVNSGLEADLAVTLDHEIGHHIHMSFMPKGTAVGEKYWQEYLALRGGVWHDPGQVNTAEWSRSSEETFAEDFRMLFGKDQPYFGDVALGDPRTNPDQAGEVKNFIIQLGNQPPQQHYVSPWIPAGIGLTFWNRQDILLTMMWACLGTIGFTINHRFKSGQSINQAHSGR
jgi:hypothetical protein